jgi:hypothetical protein
MSQLRQWISLAVVAAVLGCGVTPPSDQADVGARSGAVDTASGQDSGSPVDAGTPGAGTGDVALGDADLADVEPPADIEPPTDAEPGSPRLARATRAASAPGFPRCQALASEQGTALRRRGRPSLPHTRTHPVAV